MSTYPRLLQCDLVDRLHRLMDHVCSLESWLGLLEVKVHESSSMTEDVGQKRHDRARLPLCLASLSAAGFALSALPNGRVRSGIGLW